MEGRADFGEVIPWTKISFANWRNVSDRSTRDSDWASRRTTRRKASAKTPLLSHRELVSGPFCHSKYPEVDGSLLARAPEYRTHSRQAQRRYVQGVTTAF